MASYLLSSLLPKETRAEATRRLQEIDPDHKSKPAGHGMGLIVETTVSMSTQERDDLNLLPYNG